MALILEEILKNSRTVNSNTNIDLRLLSQVSAHRGINEAMSITFYLYYLYRVIKRLGDFQARPLYYRSTDTRHNKVQI